MATREDEPNPPAAAAAAAPDPSDDSSNDSSDSDSETPTQVEWLATGRAKRSTAGNRMKSMLAAEEPAADDDDLELLFAEDADDAGFTDEDRGADSDAQMDSSSDEEDGGKDGEDELAGERELERKEKEKRAAARKRKAQEAIPAKFRKKVRISQPAAVEEAPKPPRPKKKSERASWLPSPADMPTRASSRKTTQVQKTQLHMQMVEREKRRVKLLAQMEKKAREAELRKKPPKTQAERLAEAAVVEKRNSKSLNRWEESEKQREEERQAKLAALYNRKLEGPVVTFWSGIMELDEEQVKHAGRMVTVEEKAPRKKRMTKAEQLLASMQKEQEEAAEKARLGKEEKDKLAGKAGESVDKPAETKNGDGEPGKTAELMMRPRTPVSNDNSKAPVPATPVATGTPTLPPPGPQTASQPTVAPQNTWQRIPANPAPSEPQISQATSSFHDAVFQPISPPRVMAVPAIPQPPAPSVPEAPKPATSGVLAPPSSLNMLALPRAPSPAMMGGMMAPPDFSAMGTSGPRSSFLAPPAEPSQTPSPLAPPAPVMAPPSMSPMSMAPPPPPPLPRLSPSPATSAFAPPPSMIPAAAPVAAPLAGPVFAPIVAPSISGTSPVAPPTALPAATAPAPATISRKGSKVSLKSANEPEVAKDVGTPKESDTPLDSRITRSCIIMQNFDEEKIKDKGIQTQILFGRKMIKAARTTVTVKQPLCVVTNEVAKYRDPKTGLLFSNVQAYKNLRAATEGNYKWSNLLGLWVGSGQAAAKGVPPAFLTGVVPEVTPAEKPTEKKEGVVEGSDAAPAAVAAAGATGEAAGGTPGQLGEAPKANEPVPQNQAVAV